jgi:hypothetical protein
MESTALPAGRLPTRPARLPLLALVTLVTAIAGVGAFLAIGLFQAGAPAQEAPAQEGTYGVTEGIPTSFGAFSVEAVDKFGGPTAEDLAGQTHAEGLTPPDKTQVQVAFTLTNLLEQAVEYTPAQLTLLSVDKGADPESGKRIALRDASVEPGTLQPQASVNARATFIAPREGQDLYVELRDPRSPEPIIVDLGRTSVTPEGAFDGAHQGHQQP